MEQVDALWNCLAVDPLSSDDCLNWFLTTAKSKDYHALTVSTMRHIFIDKVCVLYAPHLYVCCMFCMETVAEM